MVVICARWTKDSCRWSHSFPGFSFNRSLSAFPILSFISPAAALVKVVMSSRSTSTGCSGSVIRERIRSTSTAVLPEPAAADTSRLVFLVSMTCFCSSVQVTLMILPPLVSSRFLPFPAVPAAASHSPPFCCQSHRHCDNCRICRHPPPAVHRAKD